MNDPHNTFRPTDAFEYTDAYRWGTTKTVEDINERLRELSGRMDRVGVTAVPSHMLAAYRGYEDALCWVKLQILPGVVKLDDTDPTPCERLTPAGYVA